MRALRLGTERREVAGEILLALVRREDREAVEQRDGAARAVAARELEGDQRAGVRAVDRRARQPERIERVSERVRIVLDLGARVRQRIGAAVTRRIEREDRQAVAELLDQRQQRGRGAWRLVQQDNGGAPAAAAVMLLAAADGDVVPLDDHRFVLARSSVFSTLPAVLRGSASMNSIDLRNLVARKARAAMREQLLGLRRGTAAHDHEGLQHLAPIVVRDADDGRLGDRRMPAQHLLDLGG